MIKVYGIRQSRAVCSVRALVAKSDLSQTPNVAGWLGECCGRPASAKPQRA
jgi:hypothetical protein